MRYALIAGAREEGGVMRDKVNPGAPLDLQIKVDEAVEELNRLADFLADSTEVLVGQTDAIERVNRIIESLTHKE